MKNKLSIKKAIFLVVGFFAFFGGCYALLSNDKETVFKTNNLPKGVEVNGFKETYNSINGKYEVEFTIVNETKKSIDLPAVEAAMYIDGKLDGPATGGCKYPLPKGEHCSSKINWILPESKPDSVVFTFGGW